MPLHYNFMQNIIVSAINREKKIFFIYVDTESNNLNFAL